MAGCDIPIRYDPIEWRRWRCVHCGATHGGFSFTPMRRPCCDQMRWGMFCVAWRMIGENYAGRVA